MNKIYLKWMKVLIDYGLKHLSSVSTWEVTYEGKVNIWEGINQADAANDFACMPTEIAFTLPCNYSEPLKVTYLTSRYFGGWFTVLARSLLHVYFSCFLKNKNWKERSRKGLSRLYRPCSLGLSRVNNCFIGLC
jgi:hypothetical protein